MSENLTYFYGDEENRLIAAQNLYKRFCEHLATNPDRAKCQLISGIQCALGQAYAQGFSHDT